MPALNYDFVILKTVNPFNAKVSIVTLGFFILVLCAVCHKAITYLLLYPFFRLLFGTLYPAYASYKTVKSRNNKEYVKWMMYWIVFALFTCAETFTDIFFSWFPFYYEIKIIIVIWLLSPATKGSSILYRKFVHPTLSSKEQEIDEYIAKAKEQSYRQVFDLGSKSMRVLMQTALKNFYMMYLTVLHTAVESGLSDKPDDSDGSRRPLPAKEAFDEDLTADEEMEDESLEKAVKKPKAAKSVKTKANAATRKSNRKVTKTDYYEYSD